MKHLITLEIPAATAQQAVVRLRTLARTGRIEEFVVDIHPLPITKSKNPMLKRTHRGDAEAQSY